MIFHIASKAEWDEAQIRGEYAAPSLQSEGFIHCSAARQVLRVANAFYRGRTDLILLQVDEAKLVSELKWEPPAGAPAPGVSPADKFPHVYGPINLTAVAAVFDFPPDRASGDFSLPPQLFTDN